MAGPKKYLMICRSAFKPAISALRSAISALVEASSLAIFALRSDLVASSASERLMAATTTSAS